MKDIQERAFPVDRFEQLAAASDLCVLCNINFARGLLPVARRLGKPVATDVHTIANVDDDFNRDFMAAADILFCSDERLPERPEAWVEVRQPPLRSRRPGCRPGRSRCLARRTRAAAAVRACRRHASCRQHDRRRRFPLFSVSARLAAIWRRCPARPPHGDDFRLLESRRQRRRRRLFDGGRTSTAGRHARHLRLAT